MSFSKNIFSYISHLHSWINESENVATIPENQRHTIVLPGAIVEIFFLSCEKIFFYKKSGSISDLEMALFQSLADYMNRFKNVPNIRELDYFLREVPSQAAWPDSFSVTFLKDALAFMANIINIANQNYNSPISWLRNQLLSNLEISIEELVVDRIVVHGSKQDAWAIEKNFDDWQQNLRVLFQRPQLVLLFSIKS